jgi:hypothetical protein
MRRSTIWKLLALPLVAGCTMDEHPVAPLGEEAHRALITGIHFPSDVRVDDEVIVRFSVVTPPCMEFYYAQDSPYAESVQFRAFNADAPCVTSTSKTREVSFTLAAPQPAHRALVFEEPDGADSVRALRATAGQ